MTSVNEILDQQIELHRSLVDLLSEESRVIVRGDTSALANLVQAKGELAAKVQGLEIERRSLVKSGRLGDPDPEKKTELYRLITQAQDLAETNAHLLKLSLEYIQVQLHAVMGLNQSGPYSRQGKEDFNYDAAMLSREV